MLPFTMNQDPLSFYIKPQYPFQPLFSGPAITPPIPPPLTIQEQVQVQVPIPVPVPVPIPVVQMTASVVPEH